MNRKGDVFLASSFGEKDGDPRKWCREKRLMGSRDLWPWPLLRQQSSPLLSLSLSFPTPSPSSDPTFVRSQERKVRKMSMSLIHQHPSDCTSQDTANLCRPCRGGMDLPAFHCVRGESSELAHESHRLRVWCLPPCWLSVTQAEVARLSAAA